MISWLSFNVAVRLSSRLPQKHWSHLHQPALPLEVVFGENPLPRLAELLHCAIHPAYHNLSYLLSFHAAAEGEWNSSRGLLHTDSLQQLWIDTANAQNSSWTHDSILVAVVRERVRQKT